ncbi:MAG: AMP-binding protein [Deltaproteobacteria bacterium]|nr:AMP-binding protein [Deltaproteobacteria bacterium]
MIDKRTVMQVFDDAARMWPSLPALKQKRGGQWRDTTWGEYHARVKQVAKAFIKLGLEPGQGVAIIGYNSPEWFFADVAAIYAGGVPAGIYTTSSAEQCQYITDHCDASIVVVENKEQLAKFMSVRDQLPKVKAYVVIDGANAAPKEGIHAFESLYAFGADVGDDVLQARVAAQKPDDMATLIYTSGTTGNPKAVIMTHDNLTWTSRVVIDLVKVRPGECQISYLPLSHIAEQAISIHGPMQAGTTVWFAESIDALGDNLREVRPHIFLGVPRVWEKIEAKIKAAGAQNTGLKKKIAAWARKVGLEGGMAEQEGRSKPFLYPLANKLVFSKVRVKLGLDRCRFQITSAAPIGRDTLDFFLSLGVPIYEVYGMSECTGPATVSVPHRYRTGKAGFCLPGGEIKIMPEDGEVCMRGRHVFKGYLKNPDATAETIDKDGWLHSGDVGTIDSQGFLQITDRKKDLLITAGGENVAPQVIEGMLKGINVISQAVVIGDRMKFLTALVALDPERLPIDAAAAGSPARTPAEAAKCPVFGAWLQREIDKLNERLARVQTIKKITILPQELSIEGGELTPTMKVKRKVVNEKYKDVIASMYHGAS